MVLRGARTLSRKDMAMIEMGKWYVSNLSKSKNGLFGQRPGQGRSTLRTSSALDLKLRKWPTIGCESTRNTRGHT